MITRYLLTVMWRRKLPNVQGKPRPFSTITPPLITVVNEWQYQHCIHWNPVTYLLEHLESENEEHIILNGHKLTEEEYEHISTTMTVEDYTRDD